MRRRWKILLKFLSAVVVSILFYWLTVSFPQIFFRRAEFENLNIYYHGESEVAAIGERSLAKIKRSPFYNPSDTYRVFLTDSAGEYAYFTSLWRNSGGVFLIFARGNIFIRPSITAEDRLISPSGELVAADRPLNYFIAHETAHAMMFERLGWQKYLKLHDWVREGLADRTGRDAFDFDGMLARYRAGAPEMDYQISGLYLKYQLLAEFALKYQAYDEITLAGQNPPQEKIENELKAFEK